MSQSSPNQPLQGSLLMIAAMIIFAAQDGLSKHLAQNYNPVYVVVIRYWAFAGFAVIFCSGMRGGLRGAVASKVRLVQILRGMLLPLETAVVVWSFVIFGLLRTHAVFALTPLLLTAMAALFLREKVGRLQWLLVVVGMLGVLIILQPGGELFHLAALIPLLGAVMFAAYGTLTRWVGQHDSTTVSFFYLGTAGAAIMTLIAPFVWEDLTPADYPWMAALCITGAFSHWLLIKAYSVCQPALLQPFAYMQTTLAAIVGVVFFQEVLTVPLLLGTGIVMAAGLSCLLINATQAQARAKEARRAASLATQAVKATTQVAAHP